MTRVPCRSVWPPQITTDFWTTGKHPASQEIAFTIQNHNLRGSTGSFAALSRGAASVGASKETDHSRHATTPLTKCRPSLLPHADLPLGLSLGLPSSYPSRGSYSPPPPCLAALELNETTSCGLNFLPALLSRLLQPFLLTRPPPPVCFFQQRGWRGGGDALPPRSTSFQGTWLPHPLGHFP